MWSDFRNSKFVWKLIMWGIKRWTLFAPTLVFKNMNTGANRKQNIFLGWPETSLMCSWSHLFHCVILQLIKSQRCSITEHLFNLIASEPRPEIEQLVLDYWIFKLSNAPIKLQSPWVYSRGFILCFKLYGLDDNKI